MCVRLCNNHNSSEEELFLGERTQLYCNAWLSKSVMFQFPATVNSYCYVSIQVYTNLFLVIVNSNAHILIINFISLSDHCVFSLVDDGLCVLDKRGQLIHQGASVVWHISLPLMNSFNKSDAAIFPMQVMLPEDFRLQIYYIMYVVFCISKSLSYCT